MLMTSFAWVLQLAIMADGPAGAKSKEAISEAYADKYAKMTTFRVDTTTTRDAILPEADLYRDFRKLPAYPLAATVVVHRDGRIYSESVDPWTTLFSPVLTRAKQEFAELRSSGAKLFDVPYERIRQLADAERARQQTTRKPVSTILVFDGQKTWRYAPDDPLTIEEKSVSFFTVVDPSTSKAALFGESIVDQMLLSPDMPSLPNDSWFRQRNRVPGIFESAGMAVLETPQAAGGANCVVVSLPGKQTIFMDPQKAYTVLKRQFMRNGVIGSEVEAQDLQQLADGLWFPRRVVMTIYGSKDEAGGRYLGKPAFRVIDEVTRVELNNPAHLKFFSVDVPPGAMVSDQTLRPLDQNGQEKPFPKAEGGVVPATSYIMPADRADLEASLNEARRSAGNPVPPAPLHRSSSVWPWFVMLNVGMILALGFSFVIRRRRIAQRS
jgi:hypothetical protein